MNNTNLKLKIGVLAAMAGLYSAGAIAANTYDADATAEILEPISVTAGTDMDFGIIASGSVATTISIDASGVVTSPNGTGDAVVTDSAGTNLTFDIQGANGESYILDISDAVLDDAGTGATMALTIGTDDSPVTLDGTAQTVTVTATLLVGADQVAGSYSTALGTGTPITVTANYQ